MNLSCDKQYAFIDWEFLFKKENMLMIFKNSSSITAYSMKRKSFSDPQLFMVILPSKQQPLSVFPEIIHAFYLPPPGFLRLSTVYVLGQIVLCWEWIAECLLASLASAH